MYARSRDTSDKVLSADGMVRFAPWAEAEPTRREREASRDAAVEVSGHLNWQGQRCLPCPRCSRVFLASSLHRLHTPGADGDAAVCDRCKRAAIDALNY
jgi:hypothetical protein